MTMPKELQAFHKAERDLLKAALAGDGGALDQLTELEPVVMDMHADTQLSADELTLDTDADTKVQVIIERE